MESKHIIALHGPDFAGSRIGEDKGLEDTRCAEAAMWSLAHFDLNAANMEPSGSVNRNLSVLRFSNDQGRADDLRTVQLQRSFQP